MLEYNGQKDSNKNDKTFNRYSSKETNDFIACEAQTKIGMKS